MARGKRDNLIGQRFGKLVVISLNEEVSKQKRRSCWNCKCDCGNEVVVRGDCLTSRHTTSCGCCNREKASENTKDLTEMKFGRLTVIKEYGRDKRGNALWLCKCECGNEVIVRGDKLKSGNTKSCGCYKKDKLKEQWKDEEYRQMQSDKMKEQWEEMWKDKEFSDKMRGDSNPSWKGGITPIRKYLRNLPVVVKWMEDAKENVNYTCELIGKQCYVETHHIKPFCELVMEAHMLNGIQIKEIIADYTEEELKLLVAYITKWHQDFSNAIVLSKEVHYYFHNVFMKGKGRESSVEDVEEFKERYLNGEFSDLLGDDLNV